MTRDLIIGIEVGALEAAAVVFDRDGREVAAAAVPTSGSPAVYAAAIQALGEHVPDLKQRTAAVAATHDGSVPGVDSPVDTRSPGPDRLRWDTRSLDAGALQAAGLDPGIPASVNTDAALAAAMAAGLFDATGLGCSVLGSEEAHFAHPSARAAVAATGPELGSAHVIRQSDAGVVWLLDLARDLLTDFGPARSRAEIVTDFEAEVLAAPPAELLFQAEHSWRSAGRTDRAGRSNLFGLSTRHGFSHLLRAAIERFAFEASAAYERSTPSEIRLAGQIAGSEVLRTIVAGVGRAPVRSLSRERPAAAGAAIMAALGLGWEPDLATAGLRWVTPYLGPATPPDAGLVSAYDRLRPAWLSACEASGAVRSGLDTLPEPAPRPPMIKEGAAA